MRCHLPPERGHVTSGSPAVPVPRSPGRALLPAWVHSGPRLPSPRTPQRPRRSPQGPASLLFSDPGSWLSQLAALGHSVLLVSRPTPLLGVPAAPILTCPQRHAASAQHLLASPNTPPNRCLHAALPGRSQPLPGTAPSLLAPRPVPCCAGFWPSRL